MKNIIIFKQGDKPYFQETVAFLVVLIRLINACSYEKKYEIMNEIQNKILIFS